MATKPRPSRGTWHRDSLTAPDGTVYTIDSEHVRGEPRFYYGLRWHVNRWVVPREQGFPDGSYRKSTLKGRLERWVMEHHQEPA